jgi:hypothetical protein
MVMLVTQVVINIHRSSCKSAGYFCWILTELEFSWQNIAKLPVQDFTKICQVLAKLFMWPGEETGGQMDGHDKTNSCFSQFWLCA